MGFSQNAGAAGMHLRKTPSRSPTSLEMPPNPCLQDAESKLNWVSVLSGGWGGDFCKTFSSTAGRMQSFWLSLDGKQLTGKQCTMETWFYYWVRATPYCWWDIFGSRARKRLALWVSRCLTAFGRCLPICETGAWPIQAYCSRYTRANPRRRGFPHRACPIVFSKSSLAYLDSRQSVSRS